MPMPVKAAAAAVAAALIARGRRGVLLLRGRAEDKNLLGLNT
jgi:hypothetical protein